MTLTIVEPEDLTLEKSGQAQIQLGLPATYTLNVHNIGDSPAYNVTIYDALPNQADGGTCDAAPDTFVAQLYDSLGTSTVSPVFVEGTDYTVTFLGDPDCNLTINMLTPAAAIGEDQRLIVNYNAYLDVGSHPEAPGTCGRCADAVRHLGAAAQ